MGGKRVLSVCNPVLAAWIQLEERKRKRQYKRGRAAGEMREWIMRGLTGRVAGTAERCDSTEKERKTDLGLICISNSPDIQPAMPETSWFALSSPLSLVSISFHLCLNFPWFNAGFFFFFYCRFYVSLADSFSGFHSFYLHPLGFSPLTLFLYVLSLSYSPLNCLFFHFPLYFASCSLSQGRTIQPQIHSISQSTVTRMRIRNLTSAKDWDSGFWAVGWLTPGLF